ncbi:sulfurtransferase complex subunit TusB [Shewanella sp. Isolate11]|uniref:sulfurtransferase complex subunit TusB n=1 Tax=Shewanella sp. Isolate11 TaxID=2908530 RepID=UPI001EFD2859|nr:sulfurtransferase complex subunit TusB [Shewanella sp. Isolate11]MCG9696648.1 sulfurtransferase complex subunit TusB [Shewanella sp. Isolate11]
MILHLIQDSPSHNAALKCCLRYASANDSIILTGDAITAMLMLDWQQQCHDINLMLIKDEVIARGLTEQLKHYPQISQSEFVEQTLLHSKVISW